MNSIEEFFNKEGVPIPVGFTKKDVNLKAPRLFLDEFYLHYLKYTAKAGISLYSIAVSVVAKKEVGKYFIDCMNSAMNIVNEINELLKEKNFFSYPPIIPVPDKVEFIQKQSYLNGYLGKTRPIHALEIAHLYDDILSNTASRALLIGFSQVAKTKKTKDYFIRGRNLAGKVLDDYMHMLHQDGLQTPELHDHLVTKSTIPPFSEKLMVFHKIDMFSMKLRAIGNSVAINGRRDLAFMYLRHFANIGLYVEDGANIMIENEWLEKIPQATDRNHIAYR